MSDELQDGIPKRLRIAHWRVLKPGAMFVGFISIGFFLGEGAFRVISGGLSGFVLVVLLLLVWPTPVVEITDTGLWLGPLRTHLGLQRQFVAFKDIKSISDPVVQQSSHFDRINNDTIGGMRVTPERWTNYLEGLIMKYATITTKRGAEFMIPELHGTPLSKFVAFVRAASR